MTGVAELALFTDDVVTVVSFYRGLLDVPPVAEWAGGAIFAVGDAKLLVHERAATMDDGPPNEDHFALSVVDLEAACDEIRANGVQFLVEPRDYEWGRSAYVRDPDGRLVELAHA